MMGLVAFPLVPLAVGFLILRTATGGGRYCWHDLFRLALGLGLGTGLTSCAYFAALLSGTPCATWDAVFLATAAALWFCFGRKLPCVFCAGAVKSTREEMSAIRTLLPWAFAVLAASALLLFATLSSQAPHGQWDAWSIYNLRARFLFRLGPAWRHAFPAETPWSHPDYPLLLPASVARIWTYLSYESTLAQSGVALGFAIASVTLLATTVAILRDRTQAFAAGILLLSTPFFVILAAWQYADVPVAFFLLAATSLIFLGDRFRGCGQWLAGLSGLAGGLAAWTKNEGLMLFIVFALIGTVPLFFGSQKRVPASRYSAMTAGASIPLACLVYFKVVLAPVNDLVAGQTASSALSQACNIGRYVDVALAFANHTFTFAGVVPSPTLALALYVFCVGLRKPFGMTLRMTWSLLLAAVAGYFLTYILSPGDLNFRLASLDRILMQLWPAMLLVSILSVRSPV